MNILYEDQQVIVVEKPAGVDSQAARGFEPDMVSQIRTHINKLSTLKQEPYLGVIHRLDKPVGGILVYGKTKKAAASLSKQVQDGRMEKTYWGVVCGKLVDSEGNYVDYLLKDGKTNLSRIVDMGTSGAKRAELSYGLLQEKQVGEEWLSLVEIRLVTGRHHQIRVQMAGHGTPLWGDHKYNPRFSNARDPANRQAQVALCACSLSFFHPGDGKRLAFHIEPAGGAFGEFQVWVS